MTRKKFWPFSFSRERMAANTSAKPMVMTVTITISRMLLRTDWKNFASLKSLTKLSKPTNSLISAKLFVRKKDLNTDTRNG